MHPIPKRVPTKLAAPFRNMPLKNFKNQTKKTVLCWSCLSSAGR